MTYCNHIFIVFKFVKRFVSDKRSISIKSVQLNVPLNIHGEKLEREGGGGWGPGGGGRALNLYIQDSQTNPNESRGTKRTPSTASVCHIIKS